MVSPLNAKGVNNSDVTVCHNCSARRPRLRSDPRNRAIANAAIHTRKTVMLMRSHRPINGVGRFVARFGASRNVNPPNTRSTTMLVMV